MLNAYAGRSLARSLSTCTPKPRPLPEHAHARVAHAPRDCRALLLPAAWHCSGTTLSCQAKSIARAPLNPHPGHGAPSFSAVSSCPFPALLSFPHLAVVEVGYERAAPV
eukprot:366489-Chlamydomonas_euryale.AAC.8